MSSQRYPLGALELPTHRAVTVHICVACGRAQYMFYASAIRHTVRHTCSRSRLLTWGTLIRAIYLAAEKHPGNSNIKASLDQGLRHVTLLDPRTPAD
eukprot:4679763-Alexandrium_andersonii.AAC.1